MTKDDEVCLKLGREVVRMIHDVRKASGDETGYARRHITFPGGDVHMLIVNDGALANLMEAAADKNYNVISTTPPSKRN